MERLVEAIAEYLCRHRSVGLLRLTLDLTRRRLDLFAEIGAVEVVKGAAAPPTHGTDAWRTAVRETVYVLRERDWLSACGRPRWSTGQARPADKPTPQSPTEKNGVLFRLYSLFSFHETPKNGASFSPNAE